MAESVAFLKIIFVKFGSLREICSVNHIIPRRLVNIPSTLCMKILLLQGKLQFSFVIVTLRNMIENWTG
jgi:hypothetical protein